MFGFLKSGTGKLLAAVAVTVVGYEGWSRFRGSVKQFILNPMHDYAIVLGYTGAGAGGPLSASQIQGYLASSNSAGGAVGIVESTATDPTGKTITYRLSMATALQTLTVPAQALIGASFPASYGTVTVKSVTDLGTST